MMWPDRYWMGTAALAFAALFLGEPALELFMILAGISCFLMVFSQNPPGTQRNIWIVAMGGVNVFIWYLLTLLVIG